jgi:MFS family permease
VFLRSATSRVNAIAVTVPALTHAWNLCGPAFTQAFVWSSLGILVGGLSADSIGDRLGRRPLLLGSVAVYGLASLLTALVGSLLMLSVVRFFTGIGIGGAFPGGSKTTGGGACFELPRIGRCNGGAVIGKLAGAGARAGRG